MDRVFEELMLKSCSRAQRAYKVTKEQVQGISSNGLVEFFEEKE